MKIQNALSLALMAGIALPAMATDHDLVLPLSKVHEAKMMGNIYINAATNERVISLNTNLDANPRGGAPFPAEIWVRDNRIPCAQFDPTLQNTYVTAIDDLDPASIVPIGSTWLEWGDIPADTVVDGFLFSWASQEPVLNVGDGVPGLDAVIGLNDYDNGFNTCERLPLLEVTIGDLPGNSPDDPALFQLFTITIDLNDPTDPALVELGDSDGDLQGASFHNENVFTNFGDLDGDGRHDFSHSLRVVQPVPADPIEVYAGLSAPRGEFASINGEFIVDQSFPDGSLTESVGTPGDEDGIEIIAPVAGYLGVLGFTGAFTCDADGDGQFTDFATDYSPWAGTLFALYGPAGIPVDGGPQPCPADFNGDGVANFNDVVGFLGAFNGQLPTADFNGDTIINFNDVVGFLGAFNAGCP